MNLIDCSYFYVGPLQIMNARPIDDLDNNAAAVQEAITGYIERYQDEFLLKMVGKDVADVVTDHLAHLEAYQQALASLTSMRLQKSCASICAHRSPTTSTSRLRVT